MTRVKILVMSCQANRDTRQQAVRDTWARHVREGQEVFFVEGGHERNAIDGRTLQLEAPDSYADLAEKTYRLIRFCLESEDWDALVKCDDDTYVECGRLARACGDFGNYRGKPAEDQRQFVPYARGGCYWLSREAAGRLVSEPFESHRNAPWFKGNSRMRKLGETAYRHDVSIEDVMVGSLLNQSGILLEEDTRFHDSLRPPLFARRELFCNHYVPPAWMHRLERMRRWPDTPVHRLLMRMWALLPSASPPA